MDWKALRRIVTGDDEKGRSHVVIDGGAAKLIAVDETGLAEIWTAALTKDNLLDGRDALAEEDVCLEPDKGCVKVRWFTVAPEEPGAAIDALDAAAAATFAAVGATHARVDTTRHPMMHKTDTLDVIVLVKGEVDLLLDDGEAKSLKPGDVVIQRGANHAWVNRGKETALLVATLINADGK
ncbi:MAG: cupin domain-containing protein [Alphaproteobacteria bacterium]|nr:cupin domain-containing protein [Alphaproteobacteria bacterium]